MTSAGKFDHVFFYVCARTRRCFDALTRPSLLKPTFAEMPLFLLCCIFLNYYLILTDRKELP